MPSKQSAYLGLNFLPPPADLGGTEMDIEGAGGTNDGIGVVTNVEAPAPLAGKLNDEDAPAAGALTCCTLLPPGPRYS